MNTFIRAREIAHEWVSRARLRSVDVVGRRLAAFGVPSVANEGRMEIGNDVAISSIPLRSHFAVAQGATLRIGDGVQIGHGVEIFTSDEVSIGAGTTIGALVMILDVEPHGESRIRQTTSRRVRIGRDVHLGNGVIVLRGASIGDGAHVMPHTVIDGVVLAGARTET